MNHWTLSQPTANSLTVSNRVPLNPFPARPQVRWGVCEEWNPITCESRFLKTPPEASSMVLACFAGYIGRPTEWLVSCAHSLSTLDFSLTTRVAKKIVTDRQLAHGLSERSSGHTFRDTWDQACLLKRSVMRMGSVAGLEKGWHGMAWRREVGRVSTMIHEI